jgi:hypothetical protein
MGSKTNTRLGRLLVTTALLVAVFGVSVSPVFAATSNKTGTTNKSSSGGSNTASTGQATNNNSVTAYGAASPLEIGTIVALTGAGSSNVESVSQQKASGMYGVTVDPNGLSFTISSGNLANESYVATSGTYNTIVSTQGGNIKVGDFIAISSIDGVGMDAGSANTTVFGRAVTAFNGSSNVIGTQSLKTSTGGADTVSLGVIPVAIQIEHNPTKASTTVNLPKELERAGQAIAQKPISATRTYLAITILVISVVLAIVILQAGVKGGLISIGRNPLSKGHIFRGLLGVILTSIIVLIIGLFAVYLLLKL